MTGKNHIVGLLQRAERRSRVNRIINIACSTLAVSLFIPIAFKIIDLISPFRSVTIIGFLSIWAAATVTWIGWQSRKRDSLDKIAAAIDNRNGTHDELKSAY